MPVCLEFLCYYSVLHYIHLTHTFVQWTSICIQLQWGAHFNTLGPGQKLDRDKQPQGRESQMVANCAEAAQWLGWSEGFDHGLRRNRRGLAPGTRIAGCQQGAEIWALWNPCWSYGSFCWSDGSPCWILMWTEEREFMLALWNFSVSARTELTQDSVEWGLP